MKYVTLEVTMVYGDGTTEPFKYVSKTPILIREDWVFDYNNPWGELGKWDEVGIDQCIKNENGDLVYVYPMNVETGKH